ncbi:MAG TPA: phytanoyl-CoA dioxygenase family protein [Chitinophagales bacterium]|nr:phytanoyl-CoA dioxygenase family protein [Chitinophagales bacterium]
MGVSVFNNADLQRQFDRDGYIVVPFLSDEEVVQLKEVYNSVTAEQPGAFHSTSFSNDHALKQSINEQVEAIYTGKVDQIFYDIQKLGSGFLTKPVGVSGTMPVHQDWTIVDEEKYYSATIWVPLQDVDAHNGAIKVLPGSHRFSKTLRSPNMPNEFDSVNDIIDAQMKLLPMKAGEAFIFNHALLHASTLNQSSAPRLAVTYGLIPAEAKLYLYLQNKTGKVEKYAMPADMFIRYTNIGQKPACGDKIDEFDYEIKPVTKIQLQQMTDNNREFKMKRIFKDAEQQAFFEKEGYIVLPLLNKEEVNDLKQYYESLQIKDQNGFGFHVSMDQADKDMSRRVREKVWGVILPRLGEHLQDFKPFVASFVVKDPNPKGVVPAHQDWSFTDKEEEGYCSITCWTTLVETSIANGGMGVIRGSHKIMQNDRPSPSPQTPVPLAEHMFSIFPYLKTLDMKPGEVLLFDNRTFHASPPNTSTEVRLAAGVGVTQKDAQLVHYYLKPDGTKSTLIKYKVDEDFYLKYNNAALAKMYDAGELIEGYEIMGEVPYTFPKYTSDELAQLIKDAGNEFNVPMCEMLAQLFNFNMDGTQKEEPVEAVKEPEVKYEPVIEKEWVWVDDRSFFEKYTPLNIVREIKKRVVGV